MKSEVVETGINRSILMNYLAGKCPIQGPNGHHHEKSKNVFSFFSTFCHCPKLLG